MKQKLSITIDEETVEMIDEAVQKGTFRNKSHAIEFSLKRILKQEEEN